MPATFALSIEQAHLWSLGHADRARVQAIVALPGTTVDAVRGALQQLVAHHEILRTTFEQPSGLLTAVQSIHDELEASIRVSSEPVDQIGRDELDVAWDLAHDSPVRAVVTDGALVLTLPALVADPVAVSELAAAVVALVGGGAPAVEDPLQYADYCEWQRELHDASDADTERSQWEIRTPSVPVRLPFERPFDPTDAPAYEHVEIPVDANAAAAVGARVGRDAATVLAAAWHAYVARVTDEPNVGIMTWFAGRDHAETAGAIGAFGRYGVVTVDVDEDLTFLGLVDSVGRAHDWGQAHGDHLVPLDATDPVRRPSIAFSSVPSTTWGANDRFAVELRAALPRVELVHDPRALSTDDAVRTVAQLAALVAAALAAPGTAISALPLLDAADRTPALGLGDGGTATVPFATVLDAFAAQVERHPRRVAVSDGTVSRTYRELDARADAVADALVAAGVAAGDAVGLATDRSTDVVAGLLGIWKAGAAYVPLNVEHPVARLAHQLQQAGARVTLTQAALRAMVPDSATAVVLDDLPNGAPAAAGAAQSPDALAYVMYTSGSTGLPKGVEVTHRNLAAYTAALVAQLGLDTAERALRCATVTAISTDLGNTAIFPTLAAGHTVELVAPDVALDPDRFAAQHEQAPIDVLKVTPSHLVALLTAGAARVLPHHTLIVGGEALSWDLVATVRTAGSCRVLNHYGPTETTVGSCTYDAAAAPPASRPRTVPIGRPIANTRAYAVDSRGEPVPVGVPGELWIGGAGVAHGYAGDAPQTAERFAPDPFHAGGRVYRTGDKVRWLPEGQLEFLGRIDDQVKIRGFRVEPREVEQVLLAHPQVRQVAVIAREDVPGDGRLVAYVVADGYPTVESLRATVSGALPDYMAPSAFLLLGSLPLTASGKLDRRALPPPDPSLGELGRPFIEPRTDMEGRLAKLWCEVLHCERVGVEDDFFELGGHSLLAAQIVARVRSELGVDLPLHSLFTAPTVALLAIELEALTGHTDDDALDELLGDLSDLSDEEIERLLRES